MSNKSETVGNLARSMPMPAIKDGDKTQREAKAETLTTAAPLAVAGEGEELHENPETGEITVVKIEDKTTVPGVTVEVDAAPKTAIERLITGYYFEDSPGLKETTRKATKPGEPTIHTLRVARVHYKVGDGDYEIMTSTISRQRRVWSHVTGEGDKSELVIDREERKIVISAPGVMVGDNTWLPALSRGGKGNRQADPEFAALREKIRVQWLAERKAAVKAGLVVGGAVIVPDAATMNDDELGDLGLAVQK